MKKYLKGMLTGIIVGAAAGMVIIPQLDRKTQKRLKKAGKNVVDFAENSYENMMDII